MAETTRASGESWVTGLSSVLVGAMIMALVVAGAVVLVLPAYRVLAGSAIVAAALVLAVQLLNARRRRVSVTTPGTITGPLPVADLAVGAATDAPRPTIQTLAPDPADAARPQGERRMPHHPSADMAPPGADPATSVGDRRARAVAETAPLAIWHLDAAGRTLGGNARLAALFGGTPASLLGSGLRRIGPPAPDGPFGLPTGQEVDATIPGGDGTATERSVTVVASPWFEGAPGTPETVLSILDSSALRIAEAQAAHFAYHDPLTGLPNRLRFQAAVERVATGSEGGALLLLDMAGIRAVNDRLGHFAGDALLQETARRLLAAARPGDEVFRIGGDEFGVVAPGARTTHAAGAVAGRMRRALSAPLDLGTGPAPIPASIGHAQAPADASDAASLHRAAALALTQAKRDGGGVVSFTRTLGDRVARRLALRGQLADAVEHGGFELVWQPQVDARTRKVRGAEALLRWPGGPGGSAVSPAEFLPEATEAGLMPRIYAWVLDTALRQKRAWTQRGHGPAVVGVNISPATLRDPAFPEAVMASLSRHGVSPEELEVEIPEDVAARDLDAIAPVLHDLIGEGVRLSLDDFGGGLSALAHLLRLPVDQVKLDRSIVAGLPGGAREKAILRAVSALARGMEIPLLAEGVETEEQMEALLAEGCTVMQGWLFGRAVPADALVPP